MRQMLIPAVVLAGGQGTRLHELTAHECKPALNFGGKHRIIDFVLANARNSGFCNVLVATQYCPDTLHEHLRDKWMPEFRGHGGNLVVRHSGSTDYLGTANAVLRNLPLIDAMMPDHVLILAADHVYQMDYSDMLDEHLASGADVTIAAHTVPMREASQFGIMQADRSGRIVGFAEKPQRPTPIPGRASQCLASMGIYIFKWEVLRKALLTDATDLLSDHDFGKNVVPALIASAHAQCHRFRSPFGAAAKAYWRDVGTLDSYLTANLEIMRNPKLLDFAKWPVFTPRGRKGTIHAARRKGMISRDAVINARAMIHDCIVMTGAVVGRRAKLTNTIVLPGTHIPDGFVIGPDLPDGGQWFRRTQGGTCLVSQDMIDNLATAAVQAA